MNGYVARMREKKCMWVFAVEAEGKEDEMNGHVAGMGEKKMHVGFCCGS
jgi:hypothetical protein